MTEILIQTYSNVSNTGKAEIIKRVHMEASKRSEDDFGSLKVNQFRKQGDPNLLKLTTFMLSELKRIVKDESCVILQTMEGAVRIQATLKYLIQLMNSRELNKLLDE